jgi:septal ring factor EnvC (AmiA/AmiB activator)
MKNKAKKRETIKQKLINKYRLVIVNENTFEERFAFRLNRLNVFLVVGFVSIFLVVGTTYLIAFTKLREYIPGYSDPKINKDLMKLVYVSDSLQKSIKSNELYIKNVQEILAGNAAKVMSKKDTILSNNLPDKDQYDLSSSKSEREFIEKVASQDRYSLLPEAVKIAKVVFFEPVKGNVISTYDTEERRYAVGIAVDKYTPIKAVADGTVIFAEWTAQHGNVLILKHLGGFTSVYKLNASLQKKQGDLVKSGEVIATSGAFVGGQERTPYLHFELWNEGYPVNPSNYIDFE